MKLKNSRIGQSLIEVLIAMAVSVVLLGAATQLLVTSFTIDTRSKDIQNATVVAQELLDDVVTVAEDNWYTIASDDNVENGESYRLVDSVPTAGTEEVTRAGKIFTRYFTVENVSRDPVTDDIDDTGDDDPSTQKITVTVSWPVIAGATKSISLVRYITAHDTSVFYETLWNGGVPAAPGQVVLTASGHTWTNLAPPNGLCILAGALFLDDGAGGCSGPPYDITNIESIMSDTFDTGVSSSGAGFLYVVWYGTLPGDTGFTLEADTGSGWTPINISNTSGVPAGTAADLKSPTISFKIILSGDPADDTITPVISSIIINWVRGPAPGPIN